MPTRASDTGCSILGPGERALSIFDEVTKDILCFLQDFLVEFLNGLRKLKVQSQRTGLRPFCRQSSDALGQEQEALRDKAMKRGCRVAPGSRQAKVPCASKKKGGKVRLCLREVAPEERQQAPQNLPTPSRVPCEIAANLRRKKERGNERVIALTCTLSSHQAGWGVFPPEEETTKTRLRLVFKNLSF